jgi:hypothetical protein
MDILIAIILWIAKMISIAFAVEIGVVAAWKVILKRRGEK